MRCWVLSQRRLIKTSEVIWRAASLELSACLSPTELHWTWLVCCRSKLCASSLTWRRLLLLLLLSFWPHFFLLAFIIILSAAWKSKCVSASLPASVCFQSAHVLLSLLGWSNDSKQSLKLSWSLVQLHFPSFIYRARLLSRSFLFSLVDLFLGLWDALIFKWKSELLIKTMFN